MLILLCFHVEEAKQIHPVSILLTYYYTAGCKNKFLSFEVLDFDKAMWKWTSCDIRASWDIKFPVSMISSFEKDPFLQMREKLLGMLK